MLKNRFYLATVFLRLLAKADGVTTMADLAESCGISGSYAEQILADLRQCQLVLGQRGPGGGYVLDRDELINWRLIDLATKLHPEDDTNDDPLMVELMQMSLVDVAALPLP